MSGRRCHPPVSPANAFPWLAVAAYIKEMKNSGGAIASLLVRWRAGASTDGEGRSERFDADEEGRAAP
jgi:hypothetical protein